MTTPTANPARALLNDLSEKFAVFKDSKPLAIGINKLLLARLPEIDNKVLRTTLRHHTSSVRYLKAMEKATLRYDLDGNPAGEVTDEQRQHAADVLKERFKKQADQRKAAAEADRAEAIRVEKLAQLTEKFGRKTN